ncbi:hypothetical protein JYU34_007753 [Plutella xylostella]|uniref:Mitochondrial inner membrane protease ATP23 n=1 Tax=Plutella xylostella TaxID=51655 RepID=A0ABQ7QRA2_PLUXY|nr:hypothetical protein JYU34_007753 [Plutella xylostella]
MEQNAKASEVPKSAEVKPEEGSTKSKEDKKAEPWGYDLYPERRGTFSPKLTNVLIGKEGKEGIEKMKCEKNVYECVKNSPIVKIMMRALKSSGCAVDLRRHISCEVCDYSVSGGYDPELNQIVVCQNVSTRQGMVQGVLAHEMIHMFDYCRNQLDFKNMEHLACTEIRAANLTHCSFMSAWSQGDASYTRIKKAHQVCDDFVHIVYYISYRRQPHPLLVHERLVAGRRLLYQDQEGASGL